MYFAASVALRGSPKISGVSMPAIAASPTTRRLYRRVRAGARLAGMELQHRIFQAAGDEIVLERPLVLEILLRLAARHLVKRRLRDEKMAAVDDLAHLPVEEGEQQRADVRAVDVGIRHDDDLVVAQLVGIELVAYPGSERRDERADFLAGQHLVHARALDVEDFAAQRQHRLERAIAALLGRAAGAVALDDEQFGFRGVALLAIGELAGEGRHIERALSARELARLARGLARRRRLDHLADDDPGLRRMLLEPILQRLVDDRLDHRADLGGDELVLGLRGEFRVRHLARGARREPFAAIVAGERNPLLLRHAALLGIAGDLARERAAEAGEVGTAVALRDRVGEAQHRLVVAVVPPQRALDRHALALALDHDRRGNERRLVAVELSA